MKGLCKMSNALLNTSAIEHIATVEAPTEEGIAWVLEYHLLTMQGVAEEVYYCLKVDKCTSNGEIVESETTFAINEDYKAAKAMAEAFATGLVLPITVSEMVDEWFDGDVA